MADKFLVRDGGSLKEKEAITSSAGVADAGKVPGLNTDGKLHVSMMPTGITPEVVMCEASEALGAGEFVSLFNDGGTLKARLADATGPGEGKRAQGFVLAAYAMGEQATVYMPSNINTGLTGLSIATTYYLSTTPGAATATPPSGSGNIVQEVGYTTNDAALVFVPSKPVELA